jgi:hypothetical protein
MTLSAQIAKQLRDVYVGKNWTWVDVKETLKDITWQQATTKVDSFNTIALLVFHMNYYVVAVTKVLQGGPLDSNDKYCFDCPPIQSEVDWKKLVDKTFTDAETLAQLIENLPESKLAETFSEEKYGTYYRNITGVIEHIHYHLGQIVLLKKLLVKK